MGNKKKKKDSVGKLPNEQIEICLEIFDDKIQEEILNFIKTEKGLKKYFRILNKYYFIDEDGNLSMKPEYKKKFKNKKNVELT